MLLSKTYGSKDFFKNLVALQDDVIAIAQILYDLGWTIMGTDGKAPRIKGWPSLPREELKAMADRDFKTIVPMREYACTKYRANAINLRLRDNNVIALDCDFYNAEFTRDFVARIDTFFVPCSGEKDNAPNNNSDKALFTCAGAKGCKMFFKLVGSTYNQLPRTLGKSARDPRVTDQDGKNKQELEIKSDVSAVYGIHSYKGDPSVFKKSMPYDCVLYGPYSGYPHISQVKPDNLPTINQKQLGHIANLFNNLCAKYEFAYMSDAPAQTAQVHYFKRNNDSAEPAPAPEPELRYFANNKYLSLVYSALCYYVVQSSKIKISIDEQLQACTEPSFQQRSAIYKPMEQLNKAMLGLCLYFGLDDVLNGILWLDVDNPISWHKATRKAEFDLNEKARQLNKLYQDGCFDILEREQRVFIDYCAPVMSDYKRALQNTGNNVDKANIIDAGVWIYNMAKPKYLYYKELGIFF